MFGRQHNLHNVQHSGRVVQAHSCTIGCSAAVSGLSADFTAGSSQLMHWRSVRPEMVTIGTISFPHFGQRVVISMTNPPDFSFLWLIGSIVARDQMALLVFHRSLRGEVCFGAI